MIHLAGRGGVAPGFMAAALLALAFATAVVAQSARTSLALDDIHRIQSIGEPDFSPDGSRVAYSVSTDDTKEDVGVSDLWVVDWSSGAPRQLTSTPAVSEWAPEFSRDGHWLAFLSDEDPDDDEEGDTQLWVMPAGGGAARQVTTVPGGISDYSLSPDGTRAVVVAETGSNVGKKAQTPPPIVINRFFFKFDGRGYLTDQVRQLFVVDLENGRARQLTSGMRDHWHPEWSPDGKWIAFTAKEQGEGDRKLDYNVFVIAPQGGEPRRLSTLNGADDDPDWEGRPEWSPDSRRLVWLEGGEDKWIYFGTPQLAVADLETGNITRPGRIDRWFYKPRWAHDGKSILALIEQDRDTWLARIDPRSGKITYLREGLAFRHRVCRGRARAYRVARRRRPHALHAARPRARRAHSHQPQRVAAGAPARRAQGHLIQERRSGDSRLHGAAAGV